MTAADLIEHVAALDVVLSVDRDRLLINAPSGVITPNLREAIAKHKATIMEMLAGPPESAIRRDWVFRDCNRQLRAAEDLGIQGENHAI